MKRLPNLRQFERGFHVTAATEEHPLGQFIEFTEEDEIKHRHPGTSLGYKQALVGGYIEVLHFMHFYRASEPLEADDEENYWDVYGDEEARIKGDPVANLRASAILGHEVMGDVIFIPRAWRLQDEG
jgi:hypothetical protein